MEHLPQLLAKEEEAVRRADGERRWLHLSSAPRLAAAGSVLWDGVAVDVTERRRAEELLRESEERFRALVESAPQLIWSADPDGEVTYFSPQWLTYTGLGAEKQIGAGTL